MKDAADAERSGHQAVPVVLAEFQALRAEMVARSSAQAALVGVGLTAIGVVLGFVVKDKANSRLLLALPPITALVNVLWSIESRRIVLSGAYIRDTLWPYLRTQVRDEELPCWEDGVKRRRSGWSVLASLLTDGLMIATFAVSGAVALVVVANSNARVPAGWLAAEGAVVALSFILPLGLALTNRRVRGPAIRRILPAGSGSPTSVSPTPERQNGA